MAKLELSYLKSLFIATALMVGGWSLFSLIKLGVANILISQGIESEAMQYGIIILIVVGILVLAGFGVKAAFRKLVKG